VKLNNEITKKIIKEKIIIKKINKLVFLAQYKCPFMFMFTGNKV